MNKEAEPKPSEIPSRSIPAFSRAEKLSEVIPVKVDSTLKKAIPKPQSTWIRQAIIEKLKRVTEETS